MATLPSTTPSGVPATGLPATRPRLPPKLKVAAHPRLVELIERRGLRRQVEKVITRLIAVLDVLDPDPDLEPTNGSYGPGYGDPALVDIEGDLADDEPSLGAPDGLNQVKTWKTPTCHDDAEPSLGAPDSMSESFGCYGQRAFDQTRWAAGGREDREAVDEDGGDVNDVPHDGELDEGEHDESEKEPSLGSLDNPDQRGWARGGLSDCEMVNEDGIEHVEVLL